MCGCARWEEQYIIEWIEYHLSVGVDHFYIYSNNDNYYTLAEVLLPYIRKINPEVTYIHCPEFDQNKMYEHYRLNYSQESDWSYFSDLDEFVALPGFGQNIKNLLAAREKDFDSIQLNWYNFGPNGYETAPVGSVIRHYTKCSSKLNKHPKLLANKKILSQFAMPSMHYAPPHVASCDALGNPISSYMWVEGGQAAAYENYLSHFNDKLMQAAFIVHYQHKTTKDAERRLARGTNGTWVSIKIYQNLVDNTNLKNEYFASLEESEYTFLKDYWEDYIIKKLLPQDLNLDKQAAEIYLQSGQWNQGF